jgi:hypothetical protein
MKTYEYGRIERLAQNLEKAGIKQEIIEQIMEDGENIRKGTTPEKKAEWMKGAMSRMDRLLDSQTRHSVREGCACCLGGKRLEIVKKIAKQNKTFEDRIQAANKANLVFGNGVALQEDGQILVSFAPEGLPHYGCVCLRKAKEPISITYCYCCGGHIKHHLQIALERKLECKVRSSALSSGWKKPCSFLFRIIE